MFVNFFLSHSFSQILSHVVLTANNLTSACWNILERQQTMI